MKTFVIFGQRIFKYLPLNKKPVFVKEKCLFIENLMNFVVQSPSLFKKIIYRLACRLTSILQI